MRSSRPFSVFLLLALACGCFACAANADSDPAVPSSSTRPVIVIGLVGGWIHTDNHFDHIVQLAEDLNRDYGSGVHAEIFENHQRVQARERILQLLDRDHDGTLAPGEKQNARIVLYGESWGASETITLARELEQRGIPVLLTIQVDSVAKPGENDGVTPANVAEAVNFYQPHGILHGRQEIHAEDSSRTQVIGNFRFDYQDHSVPVHGASWFARTFFKSHVLIENDPAVWTRIEKLIRSKLPAPAAHRQLSADSAPDSTDLTADLK
jgi:hypothetical protein